MKTITRQSLYIFFLLLSVSFSSFSYSAELSRLDQEKENTENMINQTSYGCDAADSIAEYADRIRGLKRDSGSICNPYLKENFSEHKAATRNAIEKPLLYIVGVLVLMTLFIKISKLQYSDENQNIKRFLFSMSISIIFLYPSLPFKTQLGNEYKIPLAEYIINVSRKIIGDKANEILKKANEHNLYYFSTITLPNYELHAAEFEELMEFFNRANGVMKGKPIVFNVTEYKGNLKAEAQAGKFSARITLPIDKECIELSNQYGFGDCKTKQINWQRQYLTEALNIISTASQNYLNSFHDATLINAETFDLNMTCEGIEKRDITIYTQKDMEFLYLKKVAACASHVYAYGMHKLKNITTDDYLENKNYLKSRKISLCTHDDSSPMKHIGFKHADALNKVQECVDTACGASGSPYMCSAAVSTFKSLKEINTYDWRYIPAYMIGNVSVNIAYNAETFGRNFRVEFVEMDNEYPINKNLASIFTLNYPSSDEAMTAEYGFIESKINWLEDQWQYYTGMGLDFSVDQINQLGLLGQDGWFGAKKFNTCLKYPNQHKDGWNCGSPLQETFLTGIRNVKNALDIIVTTYANLGKNKGTKQSSSAELKQNTHIMSSLLSPENMAVIGYFTLTSTENNIYSERSGGISTVVQNASIAIMSYMGGDHTKSMIRMYGYAQLAYGILFLFVLPMTIIYKFCIEICKFIMHFTIYAITALFNLHEAAASNGSMDNPYSRKDTDIPDWLLNAFMIIIFPVGLVLGSILSVMMFNGMFTALPVTPIEMFEYISHSSMSNASELTTGVANIINSIGSGVIVYLFFTSVISLVTHFGPYIGWTLWGNGDFITEDEDEKVHNEIMSKIKK